MRAYILGSAAGGGFPQWNCGCAICEEARSDRGRAKPRLEDSVAISTNGDVFLLNAAPDVIFQIRACPALRPRAPRRSPLRGVVLTNGDLDHCLGLFSLRESHPLTIYATEAVYRSLAEENAIFRTLERFPGHSVWHKLELDRPTRLVGCDGADTGLEIVARPAAGKLPLHLEAKGRPSPEQNVGVWVRDTRTGKQLAYVPSAASVDGLVGHLDEADCVVFDGTFWSSDEMIRMGVSTRRAEDLAHIPVGGDAGSLAKLRWLRAPRKVYTHLNNTNPLLLLGSEERRAVLREGWEIAEDGMEIDL